MRNKFIEILIQEARKNSHIALVVGDLGYGVVEPFAEEFPERFINAGVAEQNMMTMAAGMASEGMHIFVYSIANFPLFRCAEQIRNDVDYHNLPVTIVSVGGGLAYGAMGYSHHALQDYGLIRNFPNTLIASPGDPLEVESCLRYLIKNPQPSYFRLGKTGEKNLHKVAPELSPGEWVKVKDSKKKGSSKLLFLTTGACLQLVSDWTQEKQLESFQIYSCPLWGSSSGELQDDLLKQYDLIISVEDHFLSGGFGSWLLESSAGTGSSINLRTMALSSSVFGEVGSQSALNELGGLNSKEALDLYREYKK